MEMPQQPQPAQGAGLGAMLQAKGSATGVGKQSMEKMMATARGLPDSELADVLAGKSMRVPQFAAMLAAMGRESLRKAVAGAQAGQAKEPSTKDQMLARMQPQAQQPPAPTGIAAVPAPNMETVSAAEGGIIGFSGEKDSAVKDPDKQTPSEKAMAEYIRRINESSLFNKQVEPSPSSPPIYETDPQAAADRAAIASFGRKSLDVLGGVVDAPLKAVGTASNFLFNRPARALGLPIPEVPAQYRYGAPTPQKTENIGDSEESAGALTSLVNPAAATPPAAPKTGADKTGGAPRGTAPGIAPPAPAAPQARKSFLDGLEDTSADTTKRIAEGKNQAQGEFFMQMGAALMGNPNLGRALQQGIQTGLPGLAANRKEANALIKEQGEYRLNMAKAKEAAAQGNDELAFKYAKLAEDSKYQAGMVGAAMARSSGATAFGPKQYQAAMANAQKEVDALIAKMDPLVKRRNPPNRDQLIEAAFNRNLQAYQSGVMPPAPGIATVDEIPQGATVRG
jgi:hypothetical protein